MKVDNEVLLSRRSIRPAEPLETAVAAGQQSKGVPKAGPVDRFTPKGGIETLKKMVAELPDDGEERVASLKQRVSLGTYRVDTTLVAEKMLGSLGMTK